MRCRPRVLLLLTCVAACATPPTPPPTPAATAAPAAPPAAKSTLLEGVVRTSAGAPVVHALVALVPAVMEWDPSKGTPIARVWTSEDGGFRIERFPAGAYTLNVTAAGLTAVHRTGLKLEEGQQLLGQEVRMAAQGATLRGMVRARDGSPLPEAWVAQCPSSDQIGDCSYVQADAQGAWSVQLEPGFYGLFAEAPGQENLQFPVMVPLSAGQTLSQDVYVDLRAIETPPSAQVVEQLQHAAVPLSTVEAGHGFEDLRPLSPWVEKARVVAIGEATHGTREFFQLKHRMLEWLATEKGFTLFGIEANFAEALAVNEYVLTGKGDAAAVLAGMYFWTWNTQEVLDLIQWMRAYNADPKHGRKLKFYGFDMQYSPGSTKALLEYLRKVDPAFLAEVAPPLQPLLTLAELENPKTPPEARASYAALVARIQKRLEAQHASYAKRSSEREWRFAVRHAVLLAYLLEPSETQDGYTARDRIMAETLLWLLEQEGPDAKMVAWAHHLHVRTGSHQPFIPMGRYLREALGGSLFAFGFSFNQGSFQAMDGAQRPSRGLLVHTVAPARAGTLDASLALAGPPLYALDVRDTPPDSPLGVFLRETRRSRQFGAFYAPNSSEEKVTLAEDYDGVFFVDKTSAARALPMPPKPPAP